MHKKDNLKKLLNLSAVDYTNLTTKNGKYDMPCVRCNVTPQIDYLATYSQPSTYFHTPNTAVSFFEYDVNFNGVNGLWNSIYYNIKKRQDFFIQRFKGVRYFIAPDLSKCGDVPEIENYYRQYQSRVISIWLTTNLHAVVIPLVSCANITGMEYMLDGMQDCKMVAFNAKGPMGDPAQLEILIDSLKYTVDHLSNLESIIVYSSSPNIDKVRHYFQYALNAGISLQVPDNMLQTRNRIIGGDRNGFNK